MCPALTQDRIHFTNKALTPYQCAHTRTHPCTGPGGTVATNQKSHKFIQQPLNSYQVLKTLQNLNAVITSCTVAL